MKHNLQYYINLKYEIKIIPVPASLGGGFEARIPQLGGDAFCGYGETEKEALDTLELVKEDLFANYLKKGINIPDPSIVDELTNDAPPVYLIEKEKGFLGDIGSCGYALAS